MPTLVFRREGKPRHFPKASGCHPKVRKALLDLQRRFAHQRGGAVLDGRDIGTVIAPGAEMKIFVTAAPEIRARRRHLELDRRGDAPSFEAVLADIRKRDARDAGRADAPLKPAPDAHILDTTALDADGAFDVALAMVSGSIHSATQKAQW